MALINCPECGRQISDTTPSCPHCGYQFSTVTSTVGPTKIGAVKTNIGAGIALILLSILLVYVTYYAMVATFLFGMLAFPIFCGLCYLLFICIKNGIQKISGTQDAYCPYCGRVRSISKSKRDFKCRSCKKRSVRVGDHLKPVP